MGRPPCCDENGVKKGPWTPEEDQKLIDYVASNGHGSWRSLPNLAGLNRCGKSCRLRWTNYLRPDIKRGKFSPDEESAIIKLHSVLGNKWSKIASHLPGRTDNEIKNFWNTHLRRKLLQMGIDPNTHKPRTDLNHFLNLSQLINGITSQISSPSALILNSDHLKFQAEIANLAKLQLLQNLLQFLNIPTSSNIPFMGNNNDNLITTTATAATNSVIELSQNPNPNQSHPPEFSNDFFINSMPGFAVGLENENSSIKISDYYIQHQEDQQADDDDDDDQKKNYYHHPQLPPLVSISQGSTTTTTSSTTNSNSNINNQMEISETTNTNNSNSSSSFFDSLENLMSDETSGSYWNDILQSTL